MMRMDVSDTFVETIGISFTRLARRILLPKEIAFGAVIPKLARVWPYGISYRDFNRNVIVCHPIPLNLVIGLVRRLYHFLLRGVPPSRMDVKVFIARQEAERRGYERGRAEENARVRAIVKDLQQIAKEQKDVERLAFDAGFQRGLAEGPRRQGAAQ